MGGVASFAVPSFEFRGFTFFFKYQLAYLPKQRVQHALLFTYNRVRNRCIHTFSKRGLHTMKYQQTSTLFVRSTYFNDPIYQPLHSGRI